MLKYVKKRIKEEIAKVSDRFKRLEEKRKKAELETTKNINRTRRRRFGY